MFQIPMMTWISVFAAMTLFDFVWTFYAKAIQRSAPAAAGGWAVAVTLTSATAQIGYVNEPWLLIPAVLGAFTGTYIGLKMKHREA